MSRFAASLTLALVLGASASAVPVWSQTPADGAAESAADAAARWGLIGTWKTDCGAPTSAQNGALSYAERGGRLVHEREFGDRRDANPVLEAHVRRDGAFEVVVSFGRAGQTRRWSMTRGPDGRMRVLRNCNSEGVACSIVDGRFVHNGQPSVWQTKCD